MCTARASSNSYESVCHVMLRCQHWDLCYVHFCDNVHTAVKTKYRKRMAADPDLQVVLTAECLTMPFQLTGMVSVLLVVVIGGFFHCYIVGI